MRRTLPLSEFDYAPPDERLVRYLHAAEMWAMGLAPNHTAESTLHRSLDTTRLLRDDDGLSYRFCHWQVKGSTGDPAGVIATKSRPEKDSELIVRLHLDPEGPAAITTEVGRLDGLEHNESNIRDDHAPFGSTIDLVGDPLTLFNLASHATSEQFARRWGLERHADAAEPDEHVRPRLTTISPFADLRLTEKEPFNALDTRPGSLAHTSQHLYVFPTAATGPGAELEWLKFDDGTLSVSQGYLDAYSVPPAWRYRCVAEIAGKLLLNQGSAKTQTVVRHKLKDWSQKQGLSEVPHSTFRPRNVYAEPETGKRSTILERVSRWQRRAMGRLDGQSLVFTLEETQMGFGTGNVSAAVETQSTSSRRQTCTSGRVGPDLAGITRVRLDPRSDKEFQDQYRGFINDCEASLGYSLTVDAR